MVRREGERLPCYSNIRQTFCITFRILYYKTTQNILVLKYADKIYSAYLILTYIIYSLLLSQ